MIKARPNPRRLSDLSPEEDPHRLAPLFKHARSAPDEELPRLRWRLRTSLGHQLTRPRRLLRIALIVGGVFLSGGIVGAALRPFWESTKPIDVVTKPELPAKVAPPPVRKRVTAPSIDVPIVEPPIAPTESIEVEPAIKPLAVRSGPRRLAARSVPTPIPDPVVAPEVPVAAPPPSPIAVEQALLGDILKSLRTQRNPRAALGMLDDHARRFPDTVLVPEATMLRVEALLGLGQEAEALSLLEHAGLGSTPNPIERIVLRGELRAAAGRWREAQADFETSLGDLSARKLDSNFRDLKERALWGRASARSHLGDDIGARADLDLYLRTFPTGRFATQSAKLLKGSP